MFSSKYIITLNSCKHSYGFAVMDTDGKFTLLEEESVPLYVCLDIYSKQTSVQSIDSVTLQQITCVKLYH